MSSARPGGSVHGRVHPLPEDGEALRADEVVDAGAPDRNNAHRQHRQENEEPPPPP
jgi:hypothetical protein